MNALTVCFIILVSIGAFLILRRVVWWYWGIDRMLDHMEETNVLLRKIAGASVPGPRVEPSSEPAGLPASEISNELRDRSQKVWG